MLDALADRPTAEDAEAVVREATGAETSSERWTRTRSLLGDSAADPVARMRRRLCLPACAHRQVAARPAGARALGHGDAVVAVPGLMDVSPLTPSGTFPIQRRGSRQPDTASVIACQRSPRPGWLLSRSTSPAASR